MPTLHFQLRDGSQRSVDARNGDSVMQTALHHNLRGIDAECGGSCACATCHVVVDTDWIERLPPPDAGEDELLDAVAAGREPGSRLSCQLQVNDALDGLRLRVPATQI
jgi:ferredoxin, 2Fe-2S